MLDLQRLRLLRELQVRGTITGVAYANHFTHSAVSQQLSKLQKEAGATLLKRVGRRLELTEAGTLLAKHADVLLSQLDQAEADLAAVQNIFRGMLRVGIFQTAAMTLMPLALDYLSTNYPEVRIEMLEGGPELTVDELRLRHLDVAICQSYDHAPLFLGSGITVEVLIRDPVYLAASEKLKVLSELTEFGLSDLHVATWIAGDPQTGFGVMTERVCREIGGFAPSVLYRSDDFGVVASFVAQGHAVGLLPGMARPHVLPGVTLQEIHPRLSRDILFAIRSGTLGDPLITVFKEAMKSSVEHAVATL